MWLISKCKISHMMCHGLSIGHIVKYVSYFDGSINEIEIVDIKDSSIPRCCKIGVQIYFIVTLYKEGCYLTRPIDDQYLQLCSICRYRKDD